MDDPTAIHEKVSYFFSHKGALQYKVNDNKGSTKNLFESLFIQSTSEYLIHVKIFRSTLQVVKVPFVNYNNTKHKATMKNVW